MEHPARELPDDLRYANGEDSQQPRSGRWAMTQAAEIVIHNYPASPRNRVKRASLVSDGHLGASRPDDSESRTAPRAAGRVRAGATVPGSTQFPPLFPPAILTRCRRDLDARTAARRVSWEGQPRYRRKASSASTKTCTGTPTWAISTATRKRMSPTDGPTPNNDQSTTRVK